MSGQSEATRQSDFITPACARASDSKSNQYALAATVTAVTIDMASLLGLPVDWGNTQAADNPNPLGHYVDLTAEGGDVYVIFGPTQASVEGANVPNPATVNTVTTRVPAAAVGVPQYIPSGQTAPVKLPLGASGTSNGTKGQQSPCRYMAFVTKTGTATLRVRQSSD